MKRNKYYYNQYRRALQRDAVRFAGKTDRGTRPRTLLSWYAEDCRAYGVRVPRSLRKYLKP